MYIHVYGFLSLPLLLVGPTIVVSPQSVEVSQGENTVLPCIAEGVPTPSIQWARASGGQLPTGAVMSTFGLHLFDLSRLDNDTYRCIASNLIATEIREANVIVVRKSLSPFSE